MTDEVAAVIAGFEDEDEDEEEVEEDGPLSQPVTSVTDTLLVRTAALLLAALLLTALLLIAALLTAAVVEVEVGTKVSGATTGMGTGTGTLGTILFVFDIISSSTLFLSNGTEESGERNIPQAENFPEYLLSRASCPVISIHSFG